MRKMDCRFFFHFSPGTPSEHIPVVAILSHETTSRNQSTITESHTSFMYAQNVVVHITT